MGRSVFYDASRIWLPGAEAVLTEQNGIFHLSVPALPGVEAEGRDYNVAAREIREKAMGAIRRLIALGEPCPLPILFIPVPAEIAERRRSKVTPRAGGFRRT